MSKNYKAQILGEYDCFSQREQRLQRPNDGTLAELTEDQCS